MRFFSKIAILTIIATSFLVGCSSQKLAPTATVQTPPHQPLQIAEVGQGVPLSSPATSVDWSPDGKQLLVTGERGLAVVIAAASQTSVFSYTEGHDVVIADGVWTANDEVATLREGGNVIGLTAATGDPQYFISIGFKLSLSNNLMAVHKAQLATIQPDKLSIWNIDPMDRNTIMAEPAATAASPYEEVLVSLAWSPDGTTILTGDAVGRIMIWKLAGGSLKVLDTLLDHDSTITTLAFAPDGATFASGSVEGQLLISSSSDGAVIARGSTASHNTITSLAWSPDGTTIATGDEFGRLSLWTPDARQETVIAAHQPATKLQSISWTSAGIATVGRDKMLHIWKVQP